MLFIFVLRTIYCIIWKFVVGATTVGCVSDENRDMTSDENQLNSNLRSLSAPIRGAIRFITGGFIYVLLDGVIQKVGLKLGHEF